MAPSVAKEKQPASSKSSSTPRISTFKYSPTPNEQSFEDYINSKQRSVDVDKHLIDLFNSYKSQRHKDAVSYQDDFDSVEAYMINVRKVIDETQNQFKNVSDKVDKAYAKVMAEFTDKPYSEITPMSIARLFSNTVTHSSINNDEYNHDSINAGGRAINSPEIIAHGSNMSKIVIPYNINCIPWDQGSIFLDVSYFNANSIIVSKSSRNHKKTKSNEYECAYASGLFSKNYDCLLDKEYATLKFPTTLSNRTKLLSTNLAKKLQLAINAAINIGGNVAIPKESNVNVLHGTNFSRVGKFRFDKKEAIPTPEEKWEMLCKAMWQHHQTVVFIKTSGATYIIYNAQKFPDQSTKTSPNSEAYVKCSTFTGEQSPFCLVTLVKLDGDDDDKAISHPYHVPDRSISVSGPAYCFKIGHDEPLSLLTLHGRVAVMDRLTTSIEKEKNPPKPNLSRRLVEQKNDTFVYDPVDEIDIFFINKGCCHSKYAEKISKVYAELPSKIDPLGRDFMKEVPTKVSQPIARMRTIVNDRTAKSMDVVNYFLHQYARSAYSYAENKKKDNKYLAQMKDLVHIKIDNKDHPDSFITTTKRTLAQFPGSYLTVGEKISPTTDCR
jgi:hypothetical protein